MIDHIKELRQQAEIISNEIIIGFCEAGYPITGASCKFCNATSRDKCGRALAHTRPEQRPAEKIEGGQS